MPYGVPTLREKWETPLQRKRREIREANALNAMFKAIKSPNDDLMLFNTKHKKHTKKGQ